MKKIFYTQALSKEEVRLFGLLRLNKASPKKEITKKIILGRLSVTFNW